MPKSWDIQPPSSKTSKTEMKMSLNIIVCGAGVAGLGAAIALKKKGHQVTVVEATSQLQEIGAGIQIPPNSSRILKSWGLEEKFLTKVVLPRSILLRRYASGEKVGRIEMNPGLENKYGYPYWLIHRADYQDILQEAAVESGVHVVLGAPVESIDENKPAVRLKSGQELEADLVVGADGVCSRVRTCILKDADAVGSSQCAFRATIPADLMISDPTLSHLLSEIDCNLWLGPSGHMIGYQIRNGELYNVVLAHAGKTTTETLNKPADVEDMRTRCADWEPTVRQLLTHVTSCLHWELAYVPPLKKWTSGSGKIVIIGDAAHAMLPLMAQGAALSIEDGAALAEFLDRVTGLPDIPPVLRAFQDLRKPRCETISNAALSLVDLWHLPDGPEQEQRDLKMKQQMDGVAESDGKLSLDSMRETFIPWMYSYDTIKEANNVFEQSFD